MGLGPAFDAQFCGGSGACWMAAQDDSNRVVILEDGAVLYTSPPDAARITAVAMSASHSSQGIYSIRCENTCAGLSFTARGN